MKRTFSTLAAFALLLAPLSLHAQTAEERTRTVSNTGNEDNPEAIYFYLGNDVYGAGGTMRIGNSLGDDVNVVGGEIVIDETVRGDVHVAGGTVEIDAPVDGDVRIVGGDVVINAAVAGDVLVAGGTIDLKEDANIGGDVLLLGGSLVTQGTIEGDLIARGEEVRMLGIVNGVGDIEANSIVLNGTIQQRSRLVAKGIRTGESARIGGDLRYWSAAGLDEDFTPVVNGSVQYVPEWKMREHRDEGAAATLLAQVFSFFSLLTAIALMALLIFGTKTFFQATGKSLVARPGMSFLKGFLYFVVTPIGCVFLLMTVIGIPFAVIFFIGYLVSIYFAATFTAVVLAYALPAYRKKSKTKWNNWKLLGLSVLFYLGLMILWIIPVVGWIAAFIVICMAYGAIMTIKMERLPKVL